MQIYHTYITHIPHISAERKVSEQQRPEGRGHARRGSQTGKHTLTDTASVRKPIGGRGNSARLRMCFGKFIKVTNIVTIHAPETN